MEDSIYKISYKLKKEFHHKIILVVMTVLSVIAAVSLFLSFVAFPVLQKSDSMSPSIAYPSVSFVIPLKKEPNRGDVMYLKPYDEVKLGFVKSAINNFVGFFTGRQWFLFTSSSKIAGNGSIRRVVAIPGDEIYIQDYILHVRPKGNSSFLSEFELSHSSYTINLETVGIDWDKEMGAVANMKNIVLGEGEYFVLGDNRKFCTDSRSWGPVKLSRFRGKILLLYFPFKCFAWFGF